MFGEVTLNKLHNLVSGRKSGYLVIYYGFRVRYFRGIQEFQSRGCFVLGKASTSISVFLYLNTFIFQTSTYTFFQSHLVHRLFISDLFL